MGRPPCCDKLGVKKGPWTPEEDIMLVSYVQEHGPGNWKAVPAHTGLCRCSKSCRLRWTNYLRPGIKRGSFSDHEEKMIIQLQALLGNKWAAIASYLPERTDNDIKNYWNTHLKKKLKRQQQQHQTGNTVPDDSFLSATSHSISRGQWEKRLQTDIHTAKQALQYALSFDEDNNHQRFLNLPKNDDEFLKPSSSPSPTQQKESIGTTAYASSTENIARLLKDWTRNRHPNPNKTSSDEDEQSKSAGTQNSFINNDAMILSTENSTSSASNDGSCSRDGGIDLSEALDSLFGFESFNSSNNSDQFSHQSLSTSTTSPELASHSQYYHDESKPAELERTQQQSSSSSAPLSMLENWLFGDHQGSATNFQVKGEGLATGFSFADEDNNHGHMF